MNQSCFLSVRKDASLSELGTAEIKLLYTLQCKAAIINNICITIKNPN